MKLDHSIHIVMHSVLYLKPGVTAIVVGVLSTRYTVKSSPKNFATLCLLLLLGASLSSFSKIYSCSLDCSEDSIGAAG